jgi:hypothetical protein
MMPKRLAAFAAAVLAIALVPALASAHPIEAGQLYVPWGDAPGKEQAVQLTRGAVAQTGADASNLELVGNADKDGTTNSDLAFWGDLAYAGNYNGFRILSVRGDQPQTITDFACRGPQNDVSVYELGGRRYLFQSIDTAQTTEDCTSTDAPIVNGGRVGYEGVRVFDVTNASAPQFVDMVQTACGSHTHTLVPSESKRDRDDTAYIYVSSYPLAGSSVTPPGATGPGDYRPCVKPHKKISIIKVSSKRGQFSSELKEQPLADDTTSQNAFDNFQACHDIQILGQKDIALASCAGDGQLWDVSDPWNPTTNVPGKYTLIKSPGGGDTFEFIHSGIFSWDGKTLAMMDETGGGGTANCFGGATVDGFYYFYDVVKPGKPAPALRARYSIPRAQGQEVCVSHNASVIPVKGRDLMTAAYYQGGVTVVDFSDLDNLREVAFADLADSTGQADEWSSYWYNGRVFSNSGLGRRGATANRGVDVFRPTGPLGSATRKAERWAYSNPQTQEAWQRP